MVNSKQNAQGWGLERFSLEIMAQVGQHGSSASISSGSRQYNVDRAALPCLVELRTLVRLKVTNVKEACSLASTGKIYLTVLHYQDLGLICMWSKDLRRLCT